MEKKYALIYYQVSRSNIGIISIHEQIKNDISIKNGLHIDNIVVLSDTIKKNTAQIIANRFSVDGT